MNDKRELYQIATFQSFAQGDFYGLCTIEELKKHGDFGLGTHESIDGEFIMNNGVVYKAKFDGSIEIPADDALIPYAAITFFNADQTLVLPKITSITKLEQVLNALVSELGANMIYAARITGFFESASLRSAVIQKEPYKPLLESLKTAQRTFGCEQSPGTLVALFFPPFLCTVNAKGWHFHFISEDETIGGHAFDFQIRNAKIELEKLDSFCLKLPDTPRFNGWDLSGDMSGQIKAAETGEF